MRVLLTSFLALIALLLVPDVALAAEAVAEGGYKWGVAIGAGVAIGVGALGCGLGQGMATNGAVQGIARNPGAVGQIQTAMIIGLALIESISLYAFVIAFLMQGNL
jgi:F-type H+-transporting ATPase subunit c